MPEPQRTSKSIALLLITCLVGHCGESGGLRPFYSPVEVGVGVEPRSKQKPGHEKRRQRRKRRLLLSTEHVTMMVGGWMDDDGRTKLSKRDNFPASNYRDGVLSVLGMGLDTP